MELKDESVFQNDNQVNEQYQSSSSCQSQSDSSFDINNDRKNKTNQKKFQDDKNCETIKRKGKFGLKYAKISNRQRQTLITKVTSTGCTIKSAAKELNINFSTAKAIMQIYKREGRITKKVVRELKQKQEKSFESDRDELEPKQNIQVMDQKQIKIEVIQENYETNLYQQAEEANRQQAITIQQLGSQNIYFQNKINQLQQDKMQLTQKYEYLLIQYNQLQQMAQSMFQPRMYQFQTFAQ